MSDLSADALRRSCRRRWWTVPLLAALLVAARAAQLTEATPRAVVVGAVLALLVNAGLWAAARRDWGTGPLLLAALVLDLALVTLVVLVSGRGAALLLYLLAAEPYATDLGVRAVVPLALGSGFLSLVGRLAHARWFEAGATGRVFGLPTD